MAKILIGTSSWADRGLVESEFYPETVKTPADRLRFYSGIFSVAEIDSSYHHFPMNRELDYWLGNTPDNFVYDIKAFSMFTQHPTPLASLPRSLREEFGDEIKATGNLYWHHLPEKAAQELWAGFDRSVKIIQDAGKLGAVTFQFPPWFHPANGGFDYLSHVREMLPDLPLAVEFRFDNWLNDEHRDNTLRFLKQKNIALVCVDEPQGFRSSIPPVAAVTSSLAIVRFHGRNVDAWEVKAMGPENKFKYLYQKNELEEWLPKVREISKEAEEIHIIFKNKYADYPERNARQFARMLEIPGF